MGDTDCDLLSHTLDHNAEHLKLITETYQFIELIDQPTRITTGTKNTNRSHIIRPISFLPATSKIIERVMHTQLLEYFQAGNLLTESQSGFRPNHSTSKALINAINLWVLWRTNIDAGKLNDSEFIDLKKAFDIVDHNILLRKLCCYGVNANVFQLFKSYLTDRTQRCYVNGILSTEQYVS